MLLCQPGGNSLPAGGTCVSEPSVLNSYDISHAVRAELRRMSDVRGRLNARVFGSMTKKIFPVGERTKVYIRCHSGAGMRVVRFFGKPGRPCQQMLRCRVLAKIMLAVGAVSPFATVARSVNGNVWSCRTSSGVAISSAAVM